MKKFYLLLIAHLFLFVGQSTAQPGPVKQAAKSIFSLTTFRADGSLLASSHGVFVGNNGEAISDLAPFIGAARAVVIDANGKQMEVSRMLGVNDLYDAAHFRVDGKTTAAPMATTNAQAGSQVWLVPYSPKKAPECIEGNIKNVETFMEKYAYYIFDMNIPENVVACPLLNAQGQVLGLLQLTQSGENLHAPSAQFYGNLQFSAFSINDATMSKIGIPPALPTTAEQARLSMMILGADSLKHAIAANDFINQFPNLPDGYQARAQIETAANRFDAAARDMESVIKYSEKKDEAHYTYGQLIYSKQVYKPNIPYPAWNYERAMEHAVKAYELNPQPVYKHLQAQITFAQGQYQQAYDTFMELTKTSLRNPDLFYEAAHSKQMLAPNDTSFIALIDSAIVACDSINQVNPAPYVLARAQAWEKVGQYRKAVGDYNVYYLIMRQSLGAPFFYVREQCELKAKLYQQALIDINTAIALDQQNPLYYADRANLLLRINKPDDAITIARQCIAIAPEYSDGYLVLGLAQVTHNAKAEGLRNLEKAKSLGNEQAQPLIDKYK